MGQSAIEAVQDGDVIGLGSGSTPKSAILALGDRVKDGFNIVGIPTSFRVRELAADAGIELTTLQDISIWSYTVPTSSLVRT